MMALRTIGEVERTMTIYGWKRRRRQGLVRCSKCAVDLRPGAAYHIIPSEKKIICSSCYKKEEAS